MLIRRLITSGEMMPQPKTLYILRHAKAEIGTASQDDHDRGLNNQGTDACAVMGGYFLKHEILPELVLCSTAKRTRETWQHIGSFYAHAPKVEYSDRLYLASTNEMLNQIALVPEPVQRLMIVAHNPGLHQLSLTLAKSGNEQAIDTLALKLPTCSLVAFEFAESSWKNITRAHGEMKAFVTPKMLGQLV